MQATQMTWRRPPRVCTYSFNESSVIMESFRVILLYVVAVFMKLVLFTMTNYVELEIYQRRAISQLFIHRHTHIDTKIVEFPVVCR